MNKRQAKKVVIGDRVRFKWPDGTRGHSGWVIGIRNSHSDPQVKLPLFMVKWEEGPYLDKVHEVTYRLLEVLPRITFDEAMSYGFSRYTYNEFHHITLKNADGTPQRWRRNGMTQWWKTRPGHFKIPIKRGLREYGYITQDNAHEFKVA